MINEQTLDFHNPTYPTQVCGTSYLIFDDYLKTYILSEILWQLSNAFVGLHFLFFVLNMIDKKKPKRTIQWNLNSGSSHLKH